MKCNVWEEQEMIEKILDFHNEMLKDFGVPMWVEKCPFCQEPLPFRAIREISIKHNSRNVGDLAVQFCCSKCNQMDTIYFRQEVKSIKDVIPFLNGEKSPTSKPVIEEDMYKQQYNNMLDKMTYRENKNGN